jgi:hypothetical protein
MNLLRTRKDAEFTALSNQLADANASLVAKVAQLKKENHYLRRGNRIMPHVRIVQRAYAGAQMLALWHCGGYRTGRKAAMLNGMSDRTWYAARALLMVGRVHNGRSFTTDEPSELETALLSAVKRSEMDPGLLHARLPRSRRPKT